LGAVEGFGRAKDFFAKRRLKNKYQIWISGRLKVLFKQRKLKMDLRIRSRVIRKAKGSNSEQHNRPSPSLSSPTAPEEIDNSFSEQSETSNAFDGRGDVPLGRVFQDPVDLNKAARILSKVSRKRKFSDPLSSINSTISRDDTGGECTRRAKLLTEFSQKMNMKPCGIRSAHRGEDMLLEPVNLDLMPKLKIEAGPIHSGPGTSNNNSSSKFGSSWDTSPSRLIPPFQRHQLQREEECAEVPPGPPPGFSNGSPSVGEDNDYFATSSGGSKNPLDKVTSAIDAINVRLNKIGAKGAEFLPGTPLGFTFESRNMRDVLPGRSTPKSPPSPPLGESTNDSNHGVALQSQTSESKTIEILARENAILRQQQYQNSRIRPRSSTSNAFGLGGPYSMQQAPLDYQQAKAFDLERSQNRLGVEDTAPLGVDAYKKRITQRQRPQSNGDKIRIHDSNPFDRHRTPSKSNSHNSTSSPATSSIPMSIPNVRVPSPPPLPPPRHLADIADGGSNGPNIAWKWSNPHVDNSDWGQSTASVSPGSSLYGSFARSRNVDDRPEFPRRGSSTSTIKSVLHGPKNFRKQGGIV
jgi:hypothetical protein